jgi:hypothetical protein
MLVERPGSSARSVNKPVQREVRDAVRPAALRVIGVVGFGHAGPPLKGSLSEVFIPINERKDH